jgi:hypothetical protein
VTNVRVTLHKHTETLRIVGEVFDTSNDELEIHADIANFPAAEPRSFYVEVKPGISPAGYVEKLAAVVQPLGGYARANCLAGAGRDGHRDAGRAAPGRLGSQIPYGHGAAHRVEAIGARTAGSGPPGS